MVVGRPTVQRRRVGRDAEEGVAEGLPDMMALSDGIVVSR
jgi:hypothetical protein